MMTKKGWKNARNKLSRNSTNSANKKCLEKNRPKKLRKNVFYIHTNIVTKKRGGKTRETNFQKYTNSASKKCKEKIVGKVRKNVFYNHTNIVT